MSLKSIYPICLLLLCPVLGHTQSWKLAQNLGVPNSNTTIAAIRPYIEGTVLVSGSFAAATLPLGNNTLQNAGQDDGYVAVVDTNGQYLWAARFGGADRDAVVSAAAAPDGSIAVAGHFNSLSLTIGNTNLLGSGELDGFVVRYNTDKTIAWVKKIGSPNIDDITGVVADANGNTYVCGYVRDKLTLSTLFTFVRKYDASGNQLWEQKGTMEGGGIMAANALALGDDQDVYMAGWLWGTANFGALQLQNDTSYGAFLLRYNPSGTLVNHHLNGSLDKFNDIQIRDNHLYTCAEKVNGTFGWGWPLSDSKLHVLKMDTGFNTLWHKTAGGENQGQSLDLAKSISVDDLGNVYITGSYFSDTLHFAGQSFPNPFHINYFYPQIFVCKYSSSGDELWARAIGHVLSEEGTAILAFGEDRFFLGGMFESNPIQFGPHSLYNNSTLDSMYVHLSPSRYVRKTMGFLAISNKDTSSLPWEPQPLQILLYPNPVSDHITFQLTSPVAGPVTIQIYATDGRLLQQTTHPVVNSLIQENVPAWPRGVYWVKLSTEKAAFSGKFVKE
ncbi:MAG: T9SS type A sorting domain-containing protein [Saprospiraceae bacterium]|nr:T9SS type A sorting domain-containing protein [Saprospiraceae bacterium]